jgi:hypothetical protein
MTRFLFIFLVLLVLCLQAVAQQINFNNAVLSTPPDRLVYMTVGPECFPVVGSPTTEAPTFVAQLYYGSDASSLQPVAIGPARFRPATTGPGLWLGGNRTLIGFNIGDTVTLQVRAWDAAGTGLSFDAARAVGRWWAVSDNFTYTIPPAAGVPSAYFMHNFSSFGCIPEPSAAVSLVAGIPVVWLFLRRKRPSWS